MCFETVQSPTQSIRRTPAVETPAATPVAKARRIDANELAKQVATLVQSSGKVSRAETVGGVNLQEVVLRRGQTKALIQTATSPFGESATYVRVTRGRKELLVGNASGTGAGAVFTESSFKPGSWTKPFRLVSVS